jgi:beta-lactamase class A
MIPRRRDPIQTNYSPQTRIRSTELRRRRPHTFRRVLLLIVVVLAGSSLYLSHFDLVGAAKSTLHLGSPTKPKHSETQKSSLGQQLNAILAAYPNVTASVSVDDFSDGATLHYGTSQPLTAASVTKLVTATYFLHEVEQGNQSLTETINGYSAQWQLEEMVNQSDNDSWAALDNTLGYPQLGTYAQSIGLSSFDLNANAIATDDVALLLQKLYLGQLLNKQDTQLLLSYMQNTNDETLIPAVLPAGATIYHKYGELDGDSYITLNDAAITVIKDRPFALVVFTQGEDEGVQTELIHRLATTVDSYEN